MRSAVRRRRASFSGDGRAVAVWFRTAVTVWDVGENRLVCAIPQAGLLRVMRSLTVSASLLLGRSRPLSGTLGRGLLSLGLLGRRSTLRTGQAAGLA